MVVSDEEIRGSEIVEIDKLLVSKLLTSEKELAGRGSHTGVPSISA